MLNDKWPDLPAAEIAGTVNEKLQDNACLVVTAPPGAGKSTLLPLTVLEGTNPEGRIIMLEPRRLAVKQIAERMASLIGEPAGKTVGYRIRFENKVSHATRLEVVTEGIFTRMLTDDPTLECVSVVIFDEFHERSINSDVALALTREAQQLIRPDLRIIIMSATIDTAAICSSLKAPLVESRGRMYPVEIVRGDSIRIAGNRSEQDDVATVVARTIIRAHEEREGDILAFLPGQSEIMRCMSSLGSSLGTTDILPLYGLLSGKEQQKAIAPSPEGHRKVVLATSIAETSLTIKGVKVVVDSGLCRRPVFNQQNGLSHLETVQISKDMATQRSGRAGRVAPGTCYRLWSLATEEKMEECRTPEILEADLMSMILDIAAWGEGQVDSLSWLTPPPAAHVAMATDALRMMGAIDSEGKITKHGRQLVSLPCHPRMAQMLIVAKTEEDKALAADIAALLEERDPLAAGQSSGSVIIQDSDINTRIIALRRQRAKGLPDQQVQSGSRWMNIERIAHQYRDIVKVRENNDTPDMYKVGMLIASAFPERVAAIQSGSLGRYMLASGDTATVDKDDIIAAYDWIAVASVNVQNGTGHIFLASPLDVKDIASIARTKDNLSWDNKQGKVCAETALCIGKLVISTRPLTNITREQTTEVIARAAVKYGLSMFSFSDEVENLQQRIATVAMWHPEAGIPDVSTEQILTRAGEWLPLYIGKATTSTELKKIDMTAVIMSLLPYEQQQEIERLAPTHIQVPTGSRIKVEYRQGADQPILRVRLQECFGLLTTPCVDGGRKAVLMELLSPGFKPVQLTQDLHSFWQSTYFEVRKELRRRYPKHSWPENPLEAKAVRK